MRKSVNSLRIEDVKGESTFYISNNFLQETLVTLLCRSLQVVRTVVTLYSDQDPTSFPRL